MFAPLFSENTAVQPGHRSATLCWLSDFRPHSSPDPFGAPPGEGIFSAPLGRRAGQCPAPTSAKIPRFRGTGGFPLHFVRTYTPSGDRQIRTTPDHTCFTRLSTSTMSDSLAPGTAGRPVGRFLLALRLAKSIRHEFARRGSLQKSPGSEEPGDFVIFR